MVLIQDFIFLYLFNLGTFGLENVFGDVPDRKLVYFDHKNTYLKKLQNLHFSKGVSPCMVLMKNLKFLYRFF